MVVKLIVASLLLLLGGCSSGSQDGSYVASVSPNLAANRRLPSAQIEKFYSPIQWAKIREMNYRGYVVAEGEIAGNRLEVRKLRESFPDNSRDALALTMLKDVELKASTVGTNITPRGLAYVIFYERNIDGDLALIFAKQTDESVAGDLVAAKYFRARRY